ncbi:MAG: hypothetical protein C0601_01475 [Candidatus Muiribacterium halophilum]|uniref:Methyltransferase small domain-containing protein n=1 Tax=Muiribacterium halophilum TaxID=2053465 RepID=A0A2N5ZLP1_MUIH1|nr:MAG: hypothetical protein C0601_01475 [Candidatus Muirbacterium halophilum]
MKKEFRLEYINGKIFKLIEDTDYPFTVDPILLANFVDLSDKRKVLDLGCAGGIIEFLLLSKKESINIRAFEIQSSLVDDATENFKKNSVFGKVELIHGDYLEENLHDSSLFDLVITNPPYMKKGSGKRPDNEVVYNACFENLMNWEALVKMVSRRLSAKGSLCFIHKSTRFNEIIGTLLANKYGIKRIQFVHSFENSMSHLFMVEAVKNSRIETKILEPLVIYDDNKEYKGFLKEIFSG